MLFHCTVLNTNSAWVFIKFLCILIFSFLWSRLVGFWWSLLSVHEQQWITLWQHWGLQVRTYHWEVCCVWGRGLVDWFTKNIRKWKVYFTGASVLLWVDLWRASTAKRRMTLSSTWYNLTLTHHIMDSRGWGQPVSTEHTHGMMALLGTMKTGTQVIKVKF